MPRAIPSGEGSVMASAMVFVGVGMFVWYELYFVQVDEKDSSVCTRGKSDPVIRIEG